MEKNKKRRLILFLSTGDTCRSPMAVFYGRSRMDEKLMKSVELRGAGVMTISSLLPAQETVIVMKEDNIDVTPHRSTKLTRELIKKADLILGMTPYHVQMAKRISEQARDKTFLLMEYVEDNPKQYQIADPMGGTLETFKQTYKTIKKAVDKLLDMEARGIYRKKAGSSEGAAGRAADMKARKRGRPRKNVGQVTDIKTPDEKPAKSKAVTSGKAPKISKPKPESSRSSVKRSSSSPAGAGKTKAKTQRSRT